MTLDRPASQQDTEVVTPAGRQRAAAPPALLVCSYCSATSDRVGPTPGWVTAGDIGPYAFGVCPACQVAVYEMPAEWAR